MPLIGIPSLTAGIIMLALCHGSLYTVGVILTAVSSAVIVLGLGVTLLALVAAAKTTTSIRRRF